MTTAIQAMTREQFLATGWRDEGDGCWCHSDLPDLPDDGGGVMVFVGEDEGEFNVSLLTRECDWYPDPNEFESLEAAKEAAWDVYQDVLKSREMTYEEFMAGWVQESHGPPIWDSSGLPWKGEDTSYASIYETEQGKFWCVLSAPGDMAYYLPGESTRPTLQEAKEALWNLYDEIRKEYFPDGE